MSGEWLKFNNYNFSLDSRKEFRKRFFLKFESRRFSALKGLTLRNLAPSMKELLSKTMTSFAMLVLNRMIGALLLKLGIGRHNRKEKATMDDLFCYIAWMEELVLMFLGMWPSFCVIRKKGLRGRARL
ncbi:hypothetical protein Tco_0767156 [Tanacetum coccineum]